MFNRIELVRQAKNLNKCMLTAAHYKILLRYDFKQLHISILC